MIGWSVNWCTPLTNFNIFGVIMLIIDNNHIESQRCENQCFIKHVDHVA